jgi:hypothetical protein
MKRVIKMFVTTIVLLAVLLSFWVIQKQRIHGDLQMIPGSAEKGFAHPYFLFIPDEGLDTNQITIIIEPNNTGSPSDNFDDHVDAAKQQAGRSQIGNFLSHELRYPLLVPIFPRPEKNWKIYTHALDRDALLQKDNSLARLDLQLIAMFEDAKSRLTQSGYKVDNKFFMTGFSACGTFANRFAALHPQKVKAYAAGGLNGMLIVPSIKLDSQYLPYPLGVSDLYELTGQQFDSASFKEVPQFLFMGENDDNDAAPYDDAYDNTEREIIYNTLGKQMLPTRWNACTDYYKNIKGTFRVYQNTGHEVTSEIQQDILTFMRKYN